MFFEKFFAEFLAKSFRRFFDVMGKNFEC